MCFSSAKIGAMAKPCIVIVLILSSSKPYDSVSLTYISYSSDFVMILQESDIKVHFSVMVIVAMTKLCIVIVLHILFKHAL